MDKTRYEEIITQLRVLRETKRDAIQAAQTAFDAAAQPLKEEMAAAKWMPAPEE